MTTRRITPLQAGDRVRERDRVGDDVLLPSSPNFQQVRKILGSRRYGVVTELEIKRARNGAACQYVYVKWDHAGTPSLHARSRIEKVPD
jgi:hypothetical protein